MALYERAIKGAASEGFVQDEALARERCGRMFYEGGARVLSATYLGAARELYARWGATAKVQALEEESPALVADAAGRWSTMDNDSERAVDMFALFSALESLSGELDLGRLLQRLLRVERSSWPARSAAPWSSTKKGSFSCGSWVPYRSPSTRAYAARAVE